MNHGHYEELISLQLDDALDDTLSAKLYEHLAGCESCRKFVRTMMGVRSRIAMEQPEEVPSSLDRKVLMTFPGVRPATKHRNCFAPLWWARISIPLPAAASLAFLILFCTLLLSPLFVSAKNPQTAPVDSLKNVPAEVQTQLEMYR